MIVLHAIKASKDGREWIHKVSTNRGSIAAEFRRAQLAAENEESLEHGTVYEELPVFAEVEVFDLWRKVREQHGYAFGALFTMPDFDRGLPEGFDPAEGERRLIEAGEAYIDSLYDGEPARHRLWRRRRR